MGGASQSWNGCDFLVRSTTAGVPPTPPVSAPQLIKPEGHHTPAVCGLDQTVSAVMVSPLISPWQHLQKVSPHVLPARTCEMRQFNVLFFFCFCFFEIEEADRKQRHARVTVEWRCLLICLTHGDICCLTERTHTGHGHLWSNSPGKDWRWKRSVSVFRHVDTSRIPPQQPQQQFACLLHAHRLCDGGLP